MRLLLLPGISIRTNGVVRRTLPLLAGAALAFLVVVAVASRYSEHHLPLLEEDERLRGHRNLLFGEPRGTIYLDYYRTYSTWNLPFNLPFFEWKFHSISKAQIHGQLKGLNYWYNGRVNFKLGELRDYDGMHENVDGLPALYDFARDLDQRNLGRISVLGVKSFSANTGALGAATLDVPLGGGTQVGVPTLGTIQVAPAVIFAKDAPSSPDTPLLNLLFFAAIGFGNLSGALLAHEIGHVLGFRHTASFAAIPRESVEQYRECGLDLRYPNFDLQNLDDTQVTGITVNPTTGETKRTTYEHSDWMGRSNVMSGVRVDVLVPAFLRNQFGIYKFGYESVFDQITQCWFERSAAYEASI